MSFLHRMITRSTQHITLLALLTASCTVGRFLFSFLPNVQPMTALLLLLAFFGSLKDALIVALLSLLLTNFYLGMGPWTISQFVAFSCIICLFHLSGKIAFIKHFVFIQSILSFFMGFIYGLVVSKMEVLIYHLPSFFSYYLQGLSFDLFHSIGNGIFYLLLFPIFKTYFLPRLQSYK